MKKGARIVIYNLIKGYRARPRGNLGYGPKNDPPRVKIGGVGPPKVWLGLQTLAVLTLFFWGVRGFFGRGRTWRLDPPFLESCSFKVDDFDFYFLGLCPTRVWEGGVTRDEI